MKQNRTKILIKSKFSSTLIELLKTFEVKSLRESMEGGNTFQTLVKLNPCSIIPGLTLLCLKIMVYCLTGHHLVMAKAHLNRRREQKHKDVNTDLKGIRKAQL